nr:MAG: ORF1 [Torque teno midi virus]
MPFWWRRRRRRWYGSRYKRRYFNKYKRRRRWPRRRRRNRRAPRRRRTRRTKVRRKKKTLTVRQYQPDCIRRCKIKGIAIHVLGCQGKQFACYTDNAEAWTPELQPGGGGFGVEKFTLQNLYEQNKKGNNIWTASNTNLDLARYIGGSIKFWRHEHADFVVYYSRTLPMNLQKYTYAGTYPQNLLLRKHKKIIPSLKTSSRGKRYVKIKFGPPKLLTNKWLFQETMANTGLIQIHSSVLDLRYPHLGCCNTNELVSLYGLNLEMYKHFAWGNPTNPYGTESRWYTPYGRAKNPITVTWPGSKTPEQITIKDENYHDSIKKDSGWFQTKILQATKINDYEQIPLTACRYNPTKDTGVGNKVWLASVMNSSYLAPKTDKDLILEGLPLYELLFGFFDLIQKTKKDPTFLHSYCLFLQSPALEPQHGAYHMFCPLDLSFIQGKGAYNSYVTQWEQDHWFPTIKHQQKTVNNIVMSGPFMPKLENQSKNTWELWSTYQFNFKFGGAQLPDPETADPEQQGTYPIPNNQQQTVQITNPEKTSPLTTIHTWDYRRGIITDSAYKRMRENQQTDTDFQTDTETPKKKKKTLHRGRALPIQEEETQEMQACLQTLCEKDSCQDFQEGDLNLLIQQQHQQQQRIKQDLLKLIIDLKKKQKVLQLQTGILE